MRFNDRYKYNVENVPIDVFEYSININIFCVFAMSTSPFYSVGDFYMGYYKTYWVDRINNDHSSIRLVCVNKFKQVGFYEL